MVERRSLEEAHAEEEVTHLKQANRRVIDGLIEDNSQMSLRNGSHGRDLIVGTTGQMG